MIIYIHIFTLIFLILINCITVFAAQGFSVEHSESAKVDTMAKSALPLVIKACPGLEKYASDLQNIRASTSFSTNKSYDNSLTIEFTVSDHPTELPKPLNLYSRSNRCTIDVSKSLDKIFIAKRACHSLCTGEWTENDPNSLGREISLKR